MASSVSATNSRLSVDNWVQEGFRVLAEDGVKALTLGHLCTRLGVTKGSFYWHFSDMTAYRTALIDTWAMVRDEDRSFDALAAQPPRERLSRMMTALVGPRHWMLERAMREWARVHPVLAGHGPTLFQGLERSRHLDLVSTTRMTSGVTAMHYRRKEG